MYKKRIAEKGNTEKVETSAAVQGAMVEMWEYPEEDTVFCVWRSSDCGAISILIWLRARCDSERHSTSIVFD